jgi:hypothetical protein
MMTETQIIAALEQEYLHERHYCRDMERAERALGALIRARENHRTPEEDFQALARVVRKLLR